MVNRNDQISELAGQIPWGKLVLLWLGLFGLAALLSFAAKEQLSAFGTGLYASYGLWGLALVVLLIDTYTPGFPIESILFLALAAGGNWVELALVGGSASSLAGPMGYAHGALLDRRFKVHQRFANRPWLAKLKRYGALFVGFGALTPFPYSAINWSSGALRLPFWPCFLASWVRLARTLVFVYLMHVGWSLF
jgi:membrane protein YqaA with SNARE-associated domain